VTILRKKFSPAGCANTTEIPVPAAGWGATLELRELSLPFPVNFPVSREFGAETGSQLTAPSTSQCALLLSDTFLHRRP
jgi:hypothetical protein